MLHAGALREFSKTAVNKSLIVFWTWHKGPKYSIRALKLQAVGIDISENVHFPSRYDLCRRGCRSRQQPGAWNPPDLACLRSK